MKNAPRPDHISLQSVVTRLGEGRFVIPDFQREFEWEPKDILELMRSLFLDYYVGSLLLWKGREDTFESLACKPLSGFQDDSQNRPEHIVLDGQQRLSAMYYAFFAPDVAAPKRRARYIYFVHIDKFVNDDPEAFNYSWTQWGLNLLVDRDAQYSRRIFPLVAVSDPWELTSWFSDYKEFWVRKRDKAKAAGEHREGERAQQAIGEGDEFFAHLKELLANYQVAYIELDQDLEIDKICDTFTRINTRGIRLDIFDLMNALLRPKNVRLKDMWREAAPELEFIRSDNTNVYVLQVMSLLAQDYCSPKYIYYLLPGAKRRIRESDGSLTDQVLVDDGNDFKRRWLESVEIIKRAISQLGNPQGLGAISPRFLPYVSILPAFSAARQAAADVLPARRLSANRKVRDWYWASVFTNRYSGAVESTAARDILDVRRWIDDDDARPEVINEFAQQLLTLDLRGETRNVTATYRGILCLIILNGARDWTRDEALTAADVDDHHIIPKSWGREHDLGNRIDSILNRAPLSASTNRDIIGSRLPNQYLAEWVESQGESLVRETLRTHLISDAAFDILRRNPFDRDDFEEFLTERQHTIRDAIGALLVKGRVDLEPDLRDLDGRIEAVELEVRRVIVLSVREEERLPEHVRAKIRDRVDAALRKQPGRGREGFDLLERRLEYADLHELQEIILNRATWPEFESTFNTRELLQQRFAQIAELRNAIRHSRTANAVTKMDGQAALLWFEQALGIQGRWNHASPVA